MTVTINGSTGIDKVQDGSIVQADLASGVASTGPAFSAYASAATSMTSGVATKQMFQTKEFDTANCFDNTTNYRFTPNVAGYYQVNAAFQSQNNVNPSIAIYKNGNSWKAGSYTAVSAANPIITVSCIVYLNGSTDYIEVYATQTATGTSAVGYNSNYFQAVMVRAA